MFLNFSVVFTLLLHNFFVSFAPSNNHIIKRYNIHGIDVSHHQRNVDWQKIAEHDDFKVSFCFLKATEGSTFQDTKFKTYWNECKEAGIARGAYHFYHPTRNASDQAKNFIKSVKLTRGDLAPVLDFEKDSPSANVATVRKSLTKWLQIVEKYYGVKPIIYTNTFIYKKYIKGHFKGNPLWLADYKSGNIHSLVKNPNLKIWQYTEKGRVAGIPGHVDINAFVGAEEDFESLKIGD
ncbi:glycoside hydrolase [Lacihabitans sp. CCS-44]|uniref:glycoside hydrolase family 25 protein n=1 Tax=Lacihabitans sp. CCS-44 TaxID=2487331 RepID=UPI0020CDA19F|nr:GH25 family lysozyme [Lacihabitans sp. CCS-44]MCP9755217.1 glycoside hydrolase [Lacihabitans sp. CCS-44]